ncbi:MAG: SET domain-containing protein [Cyclobacteriaceae bacterium]|nr:SET domain-containing protein [Cyclobacteriaceae bacterium]
MTIPKGTRIVEYKGRTQPWHEVRAEDGHNGYLMYINRHTVINALHAIKKLGRYANDANGLTRKKGLRNNAAYVSEGTRCFIEATRTIKQGEEILVGYGRAYWTLINRILKQNLKGFP